MAHRAGQHARGVPVHAQQIDDQRRPVRLHHHQPAARVQHSDRLGDHPVGSHDVLQHPLDPHPVERLVGERQPRRVRPHELDRAVGMFQPLARETEQARARVDTDGGPARPHQPAHRAHILTRPAAHVEHARARERHKVVATALARPHLCRLRQAVEVRHQPAGVLRGVDVTETRHRTAKLYPPHSARHQVPPPELLRGATEPSQRSSAARRRTARAARKRRNARRGPARSGTQLVLEDRRPVTMASPAMALMSDANRGAPQAPA
jgi:hypothetical protein